MELTATALFAMSHLYATKSGTLALAYIPAAATYASPAALGFALFSLAAIATIVIAIKIIAPTAHYLSSAVFSGVSRLFQALTGCCSAFKCPSRTRKTILISAPQHALERAARVLKENIQAQTRAVSEVAALLETREQLNFSINTLDPLEKEEGLMLSEEQKRALAAFRAERDHLEAMEPRADLEARYHAYSELLTTLNSKLKDCQNATKPIKPDCRTFILSQFQAAFVAVTPCLQRRPR